MRSSSRSRSPAEDRASPAAATASHAASLQPTAWAPVASNTTRLPSVLASDAASRMRLCPARWQGTDCNDAPFRHAAPARCAARVACNEKPPPAVIAAAPNRRTSLTVGRRFPVGNLEIQDQLRDAGECRAVVAGGAETQQCRAVELGGIADIGLPAVAGPAHRQPGHRAVAHHLGDDRGGGDGQAACVAADHAAHRAGQRRGDVAVHQRQVRRAGSRATARHIASNAARRMFSRSISATEAAATAISALPDACSASNAARRCSAGQLLGVVEQGGEFARDAGGKNHGGGDHRSGERASADLVHSGDAPPGGFFQREVRHGRGR